MPKSRKRKNAQQLKQRIPQQVTVLIGEKKDTGEPVYAKVKTNKYRVVQHKPLPKS